MEIPLKFFLKVKGIFNILNVIQIKMSVFRIEANETVCILNLADK